MIKVNLAASSFPSVRKFFAIRYVEASGPPIADATAVPFSVKSLAGLSSPILTTGVCDLSIPV
jgi:hypothetical protein